MRQIFRREGWEKSDEDGVETIVHRDLKVRVAILNTDSGTADKSRTPRNRTRKGPASEKITDLNDQFEMFNPRETGAKEPEGYPLWYLCVFDNGKIVRAELSRPIEFRSSHFEKFAERIFIVSGDDWSKMAIASPDQPEAPDFDMKVRRR